MPAATEPAISWSQIYFAARAAYADKLRDPSSEKMAFGKSIKSFSLNELEEKMNRARRMAEAEGEMPVNLRSSKVGVSQLMEWDVRGFVR